MDIDPFILKLSGQPRGGAVVSGNTVTQIIEIPGKGTHPDATYAEKVIRRYVAQLRHE
jgi:hypothetical protein